MNVSAQLLVSGDFLRLGRLNFTMLKLGVGVIPGQWSLFCGP